MNITAGKLKGRKLITPDTDLVRPTLSKVRMALFNVLQSYVEFENSKFLDMYGGSGIMGLEALSRGFKSVTVIEKDRKIFQIIKKNYELLNQNAEFHNIDTLKFKTDETFDVIYIDPPYYAGVYEQTLKIMPKFKICVIEHPEDIEITGFNILKQKKYGDKILTFLTK
ncbi:16S rRNA (guanine(966)-N(2))-methyltransferase RsmD [bacterium]|nr:16S rRNA (guanine(966)-N(2))-methyltransferase RsmD [bacterium]